MWHCLCLLDGCVALCCCASDSWFIGLREACFGWPHCWAVLATLRLCRCARGLTGAAAGEFGALCMAGVACIESCARCATLLAHFRGGHGCHLTGAATASSLF